MEGISSNCYPYTVSTLVAPLSTKTYTYATTGWKDLLVSYDGQTITYDALGNPLNYRGHTLTWGKGKQLQSYDGHTFAYDATGMRIRKDSIVYEYDGKNLLREIRPNGTLTYLYDNAGICGFNYSGSNYYYQKNLQGDVTAIYDTSGILKAEYIYDAWGNCTITVDVDSIGTLNPIRYRSYYYDCETGLYYLQSRYYDPTVGKWINMDGEVSRVGGEVLGYNLFSYCFNNPMILIDHLGKWPTFGQVFSAIVGVGIVVAAVVATVAAAPVLSAAISVGYVSAAVVAAGTIACATGAMVCGCSMIGESITGSNPVKDLIGQENFDMMTALFTMGTVQGTYCMSLYTPKPYNNPVISPSDARRIQNAANRTHQNITVIGSRANGTAGPYSDWDYIMSGNSAQRHSAASSVPCGLCGGANNSGIDIFSSYANGPKTISLDLNKPFIEFHPQ